MKAPGMASAVDEARDIDRYKEVRYTTDFEEFDREQEEDDDDFGGGKGRR